ncbi:hypothetical protein Lalb_Chr07g0195521 [Lupinus albus]|uniref:Uncharacterized protein n=1 Tax=Lupinus albus TaxID=3870 RepID=A0A6A4QBK6_LUPAL|nr:hypothetical protein Lalb_Chr07g0195521 [Lupinus albus]
MKTYGNCYIIIMVLFFRRQFLQDLPQYKIRMMSFRRKRNERIWSHFTRIFHGSQEFPFTLFPSKT